MLKITKGSEPIQVKTITMCIYAQPGVGRTTLGYSADRPLLLDFDKASHRAKNRRDTVLIDAWTDVEKMTQEDLSPYRTIVVDTVGRALDIMSIPIINGDPKNNNRAGGLSLQGYGILKTTFTAWLTKIRSWGIDVVLLAHCNEERKGEDIIERLDITGSSKNEVYKVSDAMGRIYIENRARMLSFSPSDTSFGKNPGNFDPLTVPHYEKDADFLAGIIAGTKDAINAMTAEQTEVTNLLAAWKEKIDTADSASAFDALRAGAKDTDPRVKENLSRIMGATAKAKGITFDREADHFVDPPGKAPQTKQDAPGGDSKSDKGSHPKATRKPRQGELAAPEREPGQDG
jgi:phage nucleotide-binding protein